MEEHWNKHCRSCPLISKKTDNCTIQKDSNGRTILFDTFEEQLNGISGKSDIGITSKEFNELNNL